VREVAAAHPGGPVELWTMDEHRVGLRPILRRAWARRGRRPVVRVHHRYRWAYVYAFVRPATGATAWLILPRVDAAVFSLALAHFAREVGAGPAKRILLVLDRAGYHVAAEVAVPAGVAREFQPPYSPELQPAERLWPLTNEGIANRLFADIGALEEQLAEQPDIIRSHTRFHWWPDAA